jgi:SPP1 gp7 family putative phage head morphogenesis protein
MAEPTASEILHRYTVRGLALIRAANGQVEAVDRELRALSREIRRTMSERSISGATRRDLADLLREIESAVDASFAAIASLQAAAVAEVIEIEAAWAARASAFAREASETAQRGAVAELLVMGASVGANWKRQAANTRWAMATEIRAAVGAGQDDRTVVQRVIGVGPRGRERGGVMESVRRNARSLADATTHTAAHAGRLATMRANGVDSVRWFAILDAKVCPNCAMRAGKIWTIDGKPVGHNIVLPHPPPLHYWCRCLLAPLKHPAGRPPDDGGPQIDRFEDWLAGLSQDAQDRLLGDGRAQLWRDGVITLSDLIGQRGLVLSLRELRERID